MAINQLVSYIDSMKNKQFKITEVDLQRPVNGYPVLDLLVELCDQGQMAICGEVNGVPILGQGTYNNGMLHLQTVEKQQVNEFGEPVYEPTHYQDVDLLDYLINKIYTKPDFQTWAQEKDELDAGTTVIVYDHKTGESEWQPNFVRPDHI